MKWSQAHTSPPVLRIEVQSSVGEGLEVREQRKQGHCALRDREGPEAVKDDACVIRTVGRPGFGMANVAAVGEQDSATRFIYTDASSFRRQPS